ncbi:hypothetical protein CN378_10840 [Bacillus sp. AFS015802]|uniref:S-layer homology domain-containing protein n=1 Tax=Bacillus sp. AFS015802 TaxID=2033486 RepID=UPI000BF49E7C|nr:S-layer homology domain-containing protein [Bacillus sp. AFS015802]PFA67335.1 hypothetical protein CN378_10840 [Bacillus sp. AFS015802]
MKLSKSYRMFIATAATAVLVTSAVSSSAAASFTDVSDRYKEAVDYLVDQEITNGLTDTTFGVTDQIKRGDAAVMIARALDLDRSSAPESGFTDVPERARESVNILKQQGIINGKTDVKFGAEDTLTRGEMAIILSRAYALTGSSILSFTDVGDRYLDAVQAMVYNGITQGKTETQFGTQQEIMRGEFALFIYRAEGNVTPEVIEVN